MFDAKRPEIESLTLLYHRMANCVNGQIPCVSLTWMRSPQGLLNDQLRTIRCIFGKLETSRQDNHPLSILPIVAE